MARSPNFDQSKPKPPTRRKRIIDFLLDRVARRAQPQAKPERSYFERPEPDQEKQRRQPSQAQKATEIRVPEAVRRPEPSTYGMAQRDFTQAYGGKAALARQEIQHRFKSERARATALDALEDVEALKEQALEKRDAAIDKAQQDLDRMLANGKPLGQEAWHHIRDRQEAAKAAYKREIADYDRQLQGVYAQAETIDITTTIGPKKKLTYETRLQITDEHTIYMPDESFAKTGIPDEFQPGESTPDWSEYFNQVAAAEPPRPPSPGIDR